MQDFRFAQTLSWLLPGLVAAWYWGPPVGLLAFGAQMFSAPPLTRMYFAWRASRGSVDPEDIRRFNFMANIVAGCLYAYLARLIIGDDYPPPA